MDSLRQKITFGYYLIGTLVVGLSLFAFVELRLIEQKTLAGARISEFFDATLEMRRFEKNLFLYHQTADWHEHEIFVARAKQLLRDNAAEFALLAPPQRIAALAAELDNYQRLMAEYWRLQESGADGSALRASAIRASGKHIVTVAEDLAGTERAALRGALEQHRMKLVISIAVLIVLLVVAGQVLSRLVTRPLKRLEESMEAIAGGRLAKLDIRSGDREIQSLTEAFNHVMQELDLRQKHLLRSEKLASLGTLLSGVAHELNNPLSNISSSCQILLEELDGGDPGFNRELLGQIDSETLRMRNIVRTLLDFSRDRAFRRERIDLAGLIDATLSLVRGQMPTRVELNVAVAPGIEVQGDRQRLQQALINLIQNAQEALEGAGEIMIHARLARTGKEGGESAEGGYAGRQCEPGGEYVLIEVHDNGHGIPAALLERIFDPFFTTKDVGKGSGLGLFIVHEIIEEHGGCIEAHSEPEQGTTFVIRLPSGARGD